MKKHYTAINIDEKKKRAELLTRSLGPEFLNHRAGPGGGKLTYIEGKTAIELANDIFGYDGWSTEIRSMTIDQDECVNGLYTIGISAIIRVTIKEGNYHEDCGFGSAENMRSKVAALEKARKEACTDAFKRALRMFGNAVGNCLYDKRFIQNVGYMKAPVVPFEPSKLLRVRHISPREIYSGTAGGESASVSNSRPPPPAPVQTASAVSFSVAATHPPIHTAKSSTAQLPQQKTNNPSDVSPKIEEFTKADAAASGSSVQVIEEKIDEDEDIPVVSNRPPNEHPRLKTQSSLLVRDDSFTSDADDAFFEAIAMQEEKYQKEKCKSPQGKRKMPDGSEFSRKMKRTFY